MSVESDAFASLRLRALSLLPLPLLLRVDLDPFFVAMMFVLDEGRGREEVLVISNMLVDHRHQEFTRVEK